MAAYELRKVGPAITASVRRLLHLFADNNTNRIEKELARAACAYDRKS